MVLAAAFACASSAKTPNTVGPLPLISAFFAPSSSNFSFTWAIRGYSLTVTRSSTFSIRSVMPSMFPVCRASTIPSISGWCFNVSTWRFSYTYLVDTLTAGLTITSPHCGGVASLVSFSPIPSDNAVPPTTQYGTSAPMVTAIFWSSSTERCISKSSFIPVSAAAASVLPPAIPAATGMFFCRIKWTPSCMGCFSISFLAALQTKLVSSTGTKEVTACPSVSISKVIPGCGLLHIVSRSDKFTVCMIIFTS